MKILLLGDASNYHFSLSQGLTALGHEVAVASHGSMWMNTGRDIDLRRKPGKLGGAMLWLKLQNLLMSGQLSGYDVVQISNPIFLHLKPHRVRKIFDAVKKRNGGVFLTLLGTDAPYVQMCLDPYSPLKYNEFRAYGQPTQYAIQKSNILADWQGQLLCDHCRYIYENIDGGVAALYEYYLAGRTVLPEDKIAYAGIPIQMPEAEPVGAPTAGPLRVMCACHKGREAEKGVDRMLVELAKLEVANKGRMVLDLVQNVPLEEFKKRLAEAHVVVDQLYAYSPSTTPLMAMAQGKAVVTGGEKDYFDFIGEKPLPAIINPDPADLSGMSAQLQQLIDHPEQIGAAATGAVDFVRRHHSAPIVAQRFVDFWDKRLK